MKMKVLTLDDEQLALNVLNRAILSVAPEAELASFTKTDEAIQYAKDHELDVAFLDIKMPGVSGMDVARAMMEFHPQLNVIFTTGFSDYAVEALHLRSSGYLLKPVTKADVKNELDHLRHSLQKTTPDKGVFVRTFGSFDIFLDGKPLSFRRERAKELLAFLVENKGATVTRKEIAAVIFEDFEYSRATQTYLTQVVGNLKKTLEDAGIDNILDFNYNTYAINPNAFLCDAYEYMKGNLDYVGQFQGEYMRQYSWAEEYIYHFRKEND